MQMKYSVILCKNYYAGIWISENIYEEWRSMQRAKQHFSINYDEIWQFFL